MHFSRALLRGKYFRNLNGGEIGQKTSNFDENNHSHNQERQWRLSVLNVRGIQVERASDADPEIVTQVRHHAKFSEVLVERLPVLLVDSVLAEDDDAVNEEPGARSEETLQPGVVVHGVEEHEALVVVHRTAKALENNEDNREERRNLAIEELSQRS